MKKLNLGTFESFWYYIGVFGSLGFTYYLKLTIKKAIYEAHNEKEKQVLSKTQS